VPPVRAGGGNGAPADRRAPSARDVLPGPRDERRL
jgi:hypothetical protein